MHPNHKKVLEEALRLPPEARAALAGYLLESLDDSVDADAEAEWEKEIARRIDELDKGAVKMVPWSVARRQILGSIGVKSSL
jgi:putative addiction module component (TIGR02574 family)